MRKADVVDQDRGDVVDDQVDTTDLVHELHSVGEEHTSSGLYFVFLAQLGPLVRFGCARP